MELVAIRAFWSLIRVFRRLSKVERCCLMALPFAASALAAVVMLERTVAWDSAIILRRSARSEDCLVDVSATSMEEVEVASKSEEEVPDISMSSPSSTCDDNVPS